MKLFALAACSFVAIVATEVVAQPPQGCTGPQLGTWKLQSLMVEDLATGEKSEIFGPHPSGYIGYGSDCRMYAILIEDGRKTPASLVPTEAERIELYGGLIAWTGTTQVRQ